MTLQSFLVRAVLLADGERIEWSGDVGLPCRGGEPALLTAARLAAAVLSVERGADDFEDFRWTRIA